MTMIDWIQYDSEETIRSLNRLTRGGQSKNECLALIKAARKSESFLEYIEGMIKGGGGKLLGKKSWPKFEKLSEAEFKNPPRKIHGKNLWNAMSGMSPIDACRAGLWLYGTLYAIKEGVIESHYLAAGSNGNNGSGLAKIDATLNDPDKLVGQQVPLYLDTTRLILRRAYGAISDRGQKGIYTDVSFARIWWQHYLAERIAKSAKDVSADDVVDVFWDNRGIYEELAMRMSSTLTVIGDVPVRDGLMHFITRVSKKPEGAPDDFKLTNDSFELLVKRLGIMLSWRAMGALSASENSEITRACAGEIGRKEFCKPPKPNKKNSDETAASTSTPSAH